MLQPPVVFSRGQRLSAGRRLTVTRLFLILQVFLLRNVACLQHSKVTSHSHCMFSWDTLKLKPCDRDTTHSLCAKIRDSVHLQKGQESRSNRKLVTRLSVMVEGHCCYDSADWRLLTIYNSSKSTVTNPLINIHTAYLYSNKSWACQVERLTCRKYFLHEGFCFPDGSSTSVLISQNN